jgi:hypothetical protein
MEEELDKKYTGLFPPGQMITDCLNGQISYICYISNTFKLKLGHHLKLFLGEMRAATGKDIAKHIMKLAKVIPTSLVPVCYAPLLITTLRLQRYPMNTQDCWMRRQMGKRLIVLM